jgi:hypothetical protein
LGGREELVARKGMGAMKNGENQWRGQWHKGGEGGKNARNRGGSMVQGRKYAEMPTN